jgi:hypothetical protein
MGGGLSRADGGHLALASASPASCSDFFPTLRDPDSAKGSAQSPSPSSPTLRCSSVGVGGLWAQGLAVTLR